MSILSKIAMLGKFPPHVIVRKVRNRIRHAGQTWVYKLALNGTDLRLLDAPTIDYTFFDIYQCDLSHLSVEVSEHLLSMYKAHRFDLLGSGWVKNSYHTEALGLEGHRYPNNCEWTIDSKGDWLLDMLNPHHYDFSLECWELIQKLNPDYEPIDWQRDFKSGFRWDIKQDYTKQRKLMAGSPGVDLKVPWELSRLQHLPQMALLSEKIGKRQEYAVEYICQTLDFIMANPIGMGVNFNCPMDIGIRISNLFIAYDFFSEHIPKAIRKEFDHKLSRYISQSVLHVGHDMEYREGLTSNHYLGNVLGMLYYGAYVGASIKSNQYLAFGLQELYACMDRQFFNDGSNFEGSTSYHRLSGEMMAAGAFIAFNLSENHRVRLYNYPTTKWRHPCKLLPIEKQFFDAEKDQIYPDEFYQKLHKSGVFSAVITKPSGLIPQFGDNDSGRFFRFTPVGKLKKKEEIRKEYIHLSDEYFDVYPDELFWDEEGLDHSPFISAIAGLGGCDTVSNSNSPLEFSIFSQHPYRTWMLMSGPVEELAPNVWRHLRMTSRFREKIHHVPLWNPDEDHDPLVPYHFEDFQLTILKNNDVYIALSGLSNPNQHHSLSHVHNDKLQVEIELKGKPIMRDPGTYLYTPIPERRNQFRSVKAHNTACILGEEQNRPLDGRLGLFNMVPEVSYTLIRFNENGITAEIEYRDYIHHRTIEILEDGIHIIDQCNAKFEVNYEPFEYYSNGYGKLSKMNE